MNRFINPLHLLLRSRIRFFALRSVGCFAVCLCHFANAAEPLPSWSEGPSKTAIREFVAAVTEKNSKDYVKPAARIAVFDVMLLTSLFVLGGEFWDKLRALFVHESRAEFLSQ